MNVFGVISIALSVGAIIVSIIGNHFHDIALLRTAIYIAAVAIGFSLVGSLAAAITITGL